MKNLVAVLAFLFCVVASGAFALSKPADWSQSDWEKFIEEGVQIGLGEALSGAGSAVPLVDVYSALSAFGNSTNTGLRLWLNRKMQDAENQNNSDLVDRYQAYASCLDGDCSRLTQQGQTNTTNAAPSGGCFKDQGDPTGTSGRDLNGSVWNDSGMTGARCIATCRSGGFRYAATQFSNWCFCGNSYGGSGAASNCNMPCGGNQAEICGGVWANSVYDVNQ